LTSERKRSALVLAAVAVLAPCAIAAGSATAVKQFKTRVEITNGGATQFEGTVSSKKVACEADRKVILFHLGAGRRGEKVGTSRTDGEGDWAIDGDFPDGDYKARAPEVEPGNVVCLKGSSQTLPVG
jgi:hypothetical protein